MKKYLLLAALILPFIFSGCEEETEKTPIVTTLEVYEIGTTTAWAGIKTENFGGCNESAKDRPVGFVWSTSTAPTTADSKVISPYNCLGGGSLKLNGLATKTKYYIRAFSTTKEGLTVYGNELTFTTL